MLWKVKVWAGYICQTHNFKLEKLWPGCMEREVLAGYLGWRHQTVGGFVSEVIAKKGRKEVEKKKIGNFRSRNARQRISGFLASVLVFVFVFEQFFMSLSYAATAGNLASASDAVRSGKVTWKNSGADDVQLAVLSDEALYEAGDQVCLDVYIKNNTDREIYDGLLKFKAGGILEDSVYFEDIGTIYQESREDGEPEDGISEDGTSETGNPEEGDTSGGSASEEEGGVGELSYTVSKPIAGEDTGDDEEMMDGGDEEEDLSRVTDLILEPGEIRYVQFYFTIDDEIEGNKSQNIKFSFSGKADGRPVSTKETFRYVVGAMNLLPVEVGNEGKVAAGETARMQLDFELGEIEDVIMEREMELGISHNATFAKIDVASASDASASDADREDDGNDGSDDNSGNKLIKWDGEKADSGKKEDQPVIRNLKCTFDTKGVALNGFKVEKQGDDEYGTSVICTFGVDENAEPGIYFGQLNASYRIKNKDYQSSQGIMIEVTNDGLAQAVDPVARVSALIREKLPSEEEMGEKFDALEEAGDDEGYAQYIAELCEIAMPIYEEYMALTPEQQEQVEGREVLLTIASFWEAETMAVKGTNTDQLKVTAVNSGAGDLHIANGNCTAIILYGTKGQQYLNSNPGELNYFWYWGAAIVEKRNDGRLYLKERWDSKESKKELLEGNPVWTSANEFVLLWHLDCWNLTANVDDAVAMIGINGSFGGVNFWNVEEYRPYKPSGYGTLIFKPVAEWQKSGIFSFDLPRSNSPDWEGYGGNWGHNGINVANGWSQKTSDRFNFHLVGTDDSSLRGGEGYIEGKIAYCIEPGVKAADLSGSVGEDDSSGSFLDSYTSASGLKGEQIRTLIGRIISVGYRNDPNDSNDKFVSSLHPENDKGTICKAIATQLLVWEAVIGERDADFQPVEVTGTNIHPIKTIINNHPWKRGKDGEMGIMDYYDLFANEVIARSHFIELEIKEGFTWKDEDEKYVATLTDTKGNLSKGKYQSKGTLEGDTSVSVEAKIEGNDIIITTDKLPERETTVTVKVENTDKRAGIVVWTDGKYGFSESGKPLEGNLQDVITYSGSTKEDIVAEGQVTLPGNSITISKKDSDTNAVLPGAEFELYRNGSKVTTVGKGGVMTTDGSGTISLSGLNPGNYVIKETKAPEGHETPGQNFVIATFEIDGNGSVKSKSGSSLATWDIDTGKVTIINAPAIDIDVRKTWLALPDKPELMPDSIEVQLFQDGNLYRTMDLEKDSWAGKFEGLPKYKKDQTGNLTKEEYTYTVKETAIRYTDKAGDKAAYKADETSSGSGIFKVTANPDNSGGEVFGVFESSISGSASGGFTIANTWSDAENEGKLEFRILKVDAEDESKLLTGAVFELRDQNGDVKAVGEAEKDSEGKLTAFTKFTIDEPQEGTYYLYETSAPEGHILPAEPLTVTVTKTLAETVVSGNTGKNIWSWNAVLSGEGVENDTAEHKTIFRVKNNRIKGNISIAKKLNLDGKEGYRDDKSYSFAILDKDQNPVIGSDGNPIVLDVKADGTPVQTSEMLDYGDYIIVETQKDNIEEHIWEKVEFEGTDAEGKPVGSSETVKGNAGFRIKVDGHGKTVNVIATNYYSRKVVTIEGEKTWSDLQAISERGLLPQSIGLDLMRKVKDSEEDAEPVAHQTITAEDEWKYSFADQPQYADGEGKVPYVYSVVETEINYGEAGSESAPYTVEPFGKDMFKVSRKEPNNGFYEVLGVFKVTYSEPEVETNGDHTSYKIVVNNTWQVASVENQGNAYLEITKNDSQDKKPLADAVFELKIGDVTLRRRTDKEGRLTFGTDGKTASGQEDETYFERLPEGTYEMTEAEAPEGYRKLDTTWKVTVSKKLVGVTQTAENPAVWINVWEWTTDVEGDEEITNQFAVENDRIQGRISIAKALVLDGEPDTSPAGQEKEYTFGIYRGTVFTGTPVETLTVKADGSVETSGLLDYGVYTINELRRSDVEGYQWVSVTFGGVEDADKDAAGFQVMVAEQDAVLAVTATNRYDREEEETTTTGEEETTTEPESSTEESTTSEESQPESSTEESTTSEESQPESSTEESTAPEESQPESSSEESTAPEESTTSGENQPESSTAESTAPEETTAPAPVRGGGSGNGGGGGGGRDRDRNVTETVADENVPLANIDPEDVPLANLPNEPVTETPLEILDEDVPLVGLAKTGDRSVPVGALVGLMVISLFSALGISRRRKEDENS